MIDILYMTDVICCQFSVYRGLLLPRVGVEHHGIERTDIGNLGGGIYFSDAIRSVVNIICQINYIETMQIYSVCI